MVKIRGDGRMFVGDVRKMSSRPNLAPNFIFGIRFEMCHVTSAESAA
jgi:hypothetical protein